MSTYGRSLLIAEAKMGEKGCSFNEVEFLFALEHCLLTVSNEVDWRWYSASTGFTVVSGQAEYVIPDGFTVEAVKNTQGHCLCDKSPSEACMPAPVVSTPRHDLDCNIPVALQTYPTSYTIIGNRLVFGEVPVFPVGTPTVTFKMEGSRRAVPIFFDDVTVATVTTRTWRNIDLPAEYQNAFNLCLLGTLLLDKDPGQASNYYALANDSLKNVRAAKGKHRPKAMFSRRSKVGCCDGGMTVGIIGLGLSDCC